MFKLIDYKKQSTYSRFFVYESQNKSWVAISKTVPGKKGLGGNTAKVLASKQSENILMDHAFQVS